uniref:Uncharacterized protein n=1 Tax=Solanum lycopersicum TaxID=4081 RepID=A0A3Q7I168_SOLLC
MVLLLFLLFDINFSLSCIPFLLARLVFISTGIFYDIFISTSIHFLFLVFFILSLSNFNVHFFLHCDSVIHVLLLLCLICTFSFYHIFLLL